MVRQTHTWPPGARTAGSPGARRTWIDLIDDDLIALMQVAADDFNHAAVVESADNLYAADFAPVGYPYVGVAVRAGFGSVAVAVMMQMFLGAIRGKSQRLQRHLEDIVAFGGDDSRVRRHPGHQQKLRIGDCDHNIVRNNVLYRDGRLPDLGDRAPKGPDREGIYGKSGFLSESDRTHVGFADVGVDLHLGEVLRDQKQRRSLKTRGDR